MTEREFQLAESDVFGLEAGRKAATARLDAARDMCDASADQSYVVQAQATDDLLNAIAVGSEWGIVKQGKEPGGRGRAVR